MTERGVRSRYRTQEVVGSSPTSSMTDGMSARSIGCVRVATGPPTSGRGRLPRGGTHANVGPFAHALPARVAAELKHVASSAARACVRGAQIAGAGSPRLRRLAARSARDLGTACRGSRTLPPRDRARPGHSVVHDTGGGIGLRWACDHPDAVSGMVITNTGFFPDYEWHELAKAMRTEGQGEALVDSLSRDGLAELLKAASSGIDERAIDEYWKAFSTTGHRRAMLELYRSFDLDELAPYEGKLAELGVPTLVLWGEQDEFLPHDYAQRFTREIPVAKLVLLQSARHFLFEDEPERCAEEVADFLRQAGV